MDALPFGWTVQRGDQGGDGAGLLTGGDADTSTSTHVHDLFHEDAQVRCACPHSSKGVMEVRTWYGERD